MIFKSLVSLSVACMDYAVFTIFPTADQSTWLTFLSKMEELYSAVKYLWVGLRCVRRVYLVLYSGLFWCPVCEDTRVPERWRAGQRVASGVGPHLPPLSSAPGITSAPWHTSFQAFSHLSLQLTGGPWDCRQNYSVRLDVGSGNSGGSRARVASQPLCSHAIIPSHVIMPWIFLTTFYKAVVSVSAAF